MLDTKLIESALALTGKGMYFCEETVIHHEIDFENRTYAETNEEFSIEKFCYYLFDDTVLQAITEACKKDFPNQPYYKIDAIRYLGTCIAEYKVGNEQPLTNLLSKI